MTNIFALVIGLLVLIAALVIGVFLGAELFILVRGLMRPDKADTLPEGKPAAPQANLRRRDTGKLIQRVDGDPPPRYPRRTVERMIDFFEGGEE